MAPARRPHARNALSSPGAGLDAALHIGAVTLRPPAGGADHRRDAPQEPSVDAVGMKEVRALQLPAGLVGLHVHKAHGATVRGRGQAHLGLRRADAAPLFSTPTCHGQAGIGTPRHTLVTGVSKDP